MRSITQTMKIQQIQGKGTILPKPAKIASAVKRLSNFAAIHQSAFAILAGLNQNRLSKCAGDILRADQAAEVVLVFERYFETLFNLSLEVKDIFLKIDGKKIKTPAIFAKGHGGLSPEKLKLLVGEKFEEFELAKQTSPKESAMEGRLKVIQLDQEMIGTGRSRGYAIAKAMHWTSWEKGFPIKRTHVQPEEVKLETARLENSLKAAARELNSYKGSLLLAGYREAATLIQSHIEILNDPAFKESIEEKILRDFKNLEWALYETISEITRVLESGPDTYLAERADDFKDIGRRLRQILNGVKDERPFPNLKEPIILIVQDVLPSDIAIIEKERDLIKGFITQKGGETSHAVILAKQLGIPAVVGVEKAMELIPDGETVIIDGFVKRVIVNPSPANKSHYSYLEEDYNLFTQKLVEEMRGEEAVTKDGRQIILLGNSESKEGVEEVDGQGIGLFRTEYLYMGRRGLPLVGEQARVYEQAGKACIRTFDFGGDKDLPPSFRAIAGRMNVSSPIGLRGIKLALHKTFRPVFKEHLRAILIASGGNKDLSIMFPMVSTLEELLEAKKVVREVMEELEKEEIEYNPNIKIGAMIETASTTEIAKELAKEADFFSIGTNDLISLSFAIDRKDENVADYYNPRHPALYRQINRVVKYARRGKNKIPICVCGDVASHPIGALLLIGLGIERLSLIPSQIPKIKYLIRQVKLENAKKFAQGLIKGNFYESRERINLLLKESFDTHEAAIIEQIMGPAPK